MSDAFDVIYTDKDEGPGWGTWWDEADEEMGATVKYIRADLVPNDDAIKEIERIVDDACDSARTSTDFGNEAINWGDLCCVGVGTLGNNYLVFIEGASEYCPNFQRYVYDKLAAAGYENVEVRTEW